MSITQYPETQVKGRVTSSEFRKEHGIKHTASSVTLGFLGALLNALPILAGALLFGLFGSLLLNILFGVVSGTLMNVLIIGAVAGGLIFHWVKMSLLLSTPKDLRDVARLELYPKRAERKAIAADKAVRSQR